MKIHDVQQRSEEWYRLRAGRPTASDFDKLVTGTGQKSKSLLSYANQLAAEVYAGKPLDQFEGNGWTDRGKELEGMALDAYALVKGYSVERIGFVTDDQERYGCSPDSFADDGMVEVKCLKASNHVATIMYHNKYKCSPPDYVSQTQGELLVCEKPWCDLIFYHPELPMLIIRQFPKVEFQDTLKEQLDLVLSERDKILEVLRS